MTGGPNRGAPPARVQRRTPFEASKAVTPRDVGTTAIVDDSAGTPTGLPETVMLQTGFPDEFSSQALDPRKEFAVTSTRPSAAAIHASSALSTRDHQDHRVRPVEGSRPRTRTRRSLSSTDALRTASESATRFDTFPRCGGAKRHSSFPFVDNP